MNTSNEFSISLNKTKRKVLIFFMVNCLVLTGFTQTDLSKSKEVAGQFLKAMYIGDYDQARELSYDFDASRFIRDINIKIDRCIERNNCVALDSTFEFNIIGYREIERNYTASIILYECQFFYYTSEDTYGMINVMGNEDEPYRVNYVCLFEDCKDRDYPITELDDLYDLKIPDF